MSNDPNKVAAQPWETHEAEETVNAIRYGAVDAFVIEEPDGQRVYALEAADLPYSVLVETMQQGAAMLDSRGEIIYCNPSLARLVRQSRESMIGLPLKVLASDQHRFQTLMHGAETGLSEGELTLVRADGTPISANFSFRLLSRDRSTFGVLITDLTAQKQEAEFVTRLQQVQDEERRRLARELHDSVGQLVAAISMNIDRVKGEAHNLSPEVAELVTQNSVMITEINNQIRTISHLLHPPLLDEVGLPLALRWYVDGFAERSKIETVIEVPENLERLAPEVEIAAFRAVQECLANVHRHSGSASCSIRVTRTDEQLHLEIRDQGRGIPQDKLSNLMNTGGVGLRGMRERFRKLGGSLSVESNEHGTTIKARVPVHPRESSPAGQRVA